MWCGGVGMRICVRWGVVEEGLDPETQLTASMTGKLELKEDNKGRLVCMHMVTMVASWFGAAQGVSATRGLTHNLHAHHAYPAVYTCPLESCRCMVPRMHWYMASSPSGAQPLSPAVPPGEGAGGASQGAQDHGAQHPEQLYSTCVGNVPCRATEHMSYSCCSRLACVLCTMHIWVRHSLGATDPGMPSLPQASLIWHCVLGCSAAQGPLPFLPKSPGASPQWRRRRTAAALQSGGPSAVMPAHC